MADDDDLNGSDDDGADDHDDAFDEALDAHESAMIEQDLLDLTDFEATFGAEGYRGVAMWCQDCAEEHFFPWGMLRENLQLLLQTGETPVHEPAFAPEPDRYVPWDYARGYLDALKDAGVDQRLPVGVCPRCGFGMPSELSEANHCPRCGAPLLTGRLESALVEQGLDPDTIATVLRRIGLPR